MLIAVVLVLVGLGLAAGFVQAIRLSQRAEHRTVREPTTVAATNAGHLDRLEPGAQVKYDRQEWIVLGRQHVTPPSGSPAWTAWHLDDHGQPGWMATLDGDPGHAIFAVGAEQAEPIDPAAPTVVWRKVAWTRIEEVAPGPQPVEAEGRRRRLRTAPEDLTDDPVERVTFTRDELPRRRLLLERRAGDEQWAVWIGDLVTTSMIDVYPPPRLPEPAPGARPAAPDDDGTPADPGSARPAG